MKTKPELNQLEQLEEKRKILNYTIEQYKTMLNNLKDNCRDKQIIKKAIIEYEEILEKIETKMIKLIIKTSTEVKK